MSRFDQCAETCTTDCGHCKGKPVAALRAEVAECWTEIHLQRDMRSAALAEVATLTAERDRLALQVGSGEVEIDQLRADVADLRVERDQYWGLFNSSQDSNKTLAAMAREHMNERDALAARVVEAARHYRKLYARPIEADTAYIGERLWHLVITVDALDALDSMAGPGEEAQ